MVRKIIKKAKNIFFANPGLLFANEKHLVNKSFYFKGDNNKAVLLLHGWTATPYELRRLGTFLNQNGYTAYAPVLRGHGTKPENLAKVRYNDWLNDARGAFEKLKRKHDKVFVIGTSIGGTISLELAKEKKSIDGLVLMATPYRVKLEELMIAIVWFLSFFKKYRKKFYPPTFGSRKTITRVISYQIYPIANVLETAKIIRRSRKNLSLITQPCFLLQSKSDHIVTYNSLTKIFKKITSEKKQKKYIKRSYHTFISDIKNENIFEEILDFFNKN